MSRNLKFVNKEYYHIYNRGVDKRAVFKDEFDYYRFLLSLDLFNSNRLISIRDFLTGAKPLGQRLSPCDNLVEIVAYNLLPNHYHLLLRQKVNNGIAIFMHKVATGYTSYFNLKYRRSGRLFQGPYKAIHVDNNNYLLYLSAYINSNSKVHKVQDFKNWPWSSYGQYAELNNTEFLKSIRKIY